MSDINVDRGREVGVGGWEKRGEGLNDLYVGLFLFCYVCPHAEVMNSCKALLVVQAIPYS